MPLKDLPQRVVHDPIDMRGGPTPFQPGQDRERLDDIAQRARFNDKNFQSFIEEYQNISYLG